MERGKGGIRMVIGEYKIIVVDRGAFLQTKKKIGKTEVGVGGLCRL